MTNLTIRELRISLIAKLADKKDTLTILSAVSGIPEKRIEGFIRSGEIALGDFIVLRGLA